MKPKIGDTVQFKKSGITGTVEKILRGACVVKTPVSRLSAWPEDLIIVGLSEASLDKEMEEHQKLCDEVLTIQGIEPIEAEMEEVIHCPDGYIFKDENGNVINATKIVLEKKKKEYPKTYEECRDLIEGSYVEPFCADLVATGYLSKLVERFVRLIICRDAYWKLYGEEMGLGKPWKPIWSIYEHKFCLGTNKDKVIEECVTTGNRILAFPTKEMRDAFKENFDPDIEICKEFL